MTGSVQEDVHRCYANTVPCNMRFEHPQSLVSVKDLEPAPQEYQGTTLLMAEHSFFLTLWEYCRLRGLY
jgi:hypothetical protein